MLFRPATMYRLRARSERAAFTLDAVLEATARVIDEGRPLRMSTIARRAGVSVGALYRYFPSKEALLSATGGWLCDQLIGRVAAIVRDPNKSPLEILEASVNIAVDETYDHLAVKKLVQHSWLSRRADSELIDASEDVAKGLAPLLAQIHHAELEIVRASSQAIVWAIDGLLDGVVRASSAPSREETRLRAHAVVKGLLEAVNVAAYT